MSLRLILMRHAKSDWKTPAADDFDRPLNARGLAAADTVGQWLAKQGHVPEQILCSSARRTRQTCEHVVAAISPPPEIKFQKSLYLASAESMFQRLLTLGAIECAMMIGHNPGTANLAGALAEKPPAHPRFRLYPTAATTVLEFPIDHWRDLRAGQGKVLDFVVPRDIAPSTE